MLDLNMQKEEFSRAYVRAVVCVAGYATYEHSVDDDSVDLGISARGGRGTIRSPRLELQLKCTSQEVLNASRIRLRLSLKNYNDLRGEDLLVPRILVVVIVPDQVEDWLSQSEKELTMRRCGYWLSLREHPDTDNSTSETVTIPRGQVFTVDALQTMMNSIASGGTP